MNPLHSSRSGSTYSLARERENRSLGVRSNQRAGSDVLLHSWSRLVSDRSHCRRVTDNSPPIPGPQTTSVGWRRLESQAARITENLRQLHWDNCKVNFDRRLALRYALRALRDGYDAANILKCYERALQECHALATDRTASRGQICRFELFVIESENEPDNGKPFEHSVLL
jgi:hypothetical protein